MSIVVQQGWSMKHEVNFLAANVQYISYSDNKLQYASLGSRMYILIWLCKKYFVSDVSLSTASGHVLVADLPDDPSHSFSHNDGNNNIIITTLKIIYY